MLKSRSVLRLGGAERSKTDMLIIESQDVRTEKDLRQHLAFPAPDFIYEELEARGEGQGFEHRLGYT